MSKLTVNSREIGSVRIFDLVGTPTEETLQEVAWKIQRNIRRHRLQRVILNLQMLTSLEPLGLRKLLAACIRPQKSLIYGATANVTNFLEETYIPKNVRICTSEKDVAEDFGPFLTEKEGRDPYTEEILVFDQASPGYEIERRRSKRMRVALPLEMKVAVPEGRVFEFRAIATNISEGGLFAEYLDLNAVETMESLDLAKGIKIDVRILPSSNFPEEFRISGKVVRKDIHKRQLGIAVQFGV